ncbi:MAG: hypothetical protein ACJZ59_07300 [Candidatus Thalassarchaeaceae archaeon]
MAPESGPCSKRAGWSFVAWTGATASSHLTNGEGELDMRNLVYFSIGAAIVFDLIVSMAALVADPSPSVFLTYLIVGIPYDLLHVAGNVAFAAWLGPMRCTAFSFVPAIQM